MSKADQANIRFANCCINHKIRPELLASLCRAVRKAENAIVRLEVNSAGDASKYRKIVEGLAAECKLSLEWDSVHPVFKKQGKIVCIP